MKRMILVSVFVTCLFSSYSFAQMGQGHMMGYDIIGSQSNQSAGTLYGSGDYPCPLMMGPGMMGGYGMGPCMMGHMGGMMAPGSYGMRGAGWEAYETYLNDTTELRRKLHDKKFEYLEAVRKPDTKREAIRKLEKEMLDLQWDLYEKAPR